MSEQSTPPARPDQDGVHYRPADGFYGYCVGDDGTVWSCRAKVGCGTGHGTRSVLSATWHPLKLNRNAKGYAIITLRRGRRTARLQVHRLILEAFTGPCPPGMECCHEDGDPANNRLSNLRWDTHRANKEDERRHGRTPAGGRHGMAKLTAVQISEIRQRAAAGETPKALAAAFGVTRRNIYHIRGSRTWR